MSLQNLRKETYERIMDAIKTKSDDDFEIYFGISHPDISYYHDDIQELIKSSDYQTMLEKKSDPENLNCTVYVDSRYRPTLEDAMAKVHIDGNSQTLTIEDYNEYDKYENIDEVVASSVADSLYNWAVEVVREYPIWDDAETLKRELESDAEDDIDISSLKTVDETIADLEMEVKGTVYSVCIMEEVPFQEDTERWNIYNEEETYDETFDLKTILVDGVRYVTEID